MQSDDIEGNLFLKQYFNKGIKVYNSDNLFLLINDIEMKANMNKMSRIESLETTFKDTVASPVSFNNLNSLLFNKNKSNKRIKKKKQKTKRRKKIS